MFTIAKTFEFSASHCLDHLPSDHPCHNVHGHNYTVTLKLSRAGLDKRGFVVDYRELSTFKAWLDATFDHRHLNDVFKSPTTCEYLARFFYDTWKPVLRDLAAVVVSETGKTWCEYTPEPWELEAARGN